MSERVADMVREFHTTFGLPSQSRPARINEIGAATRLRLLLEETREVAEAVEAGDLPGIAQELADVVYVVYGTALVYGIDLDAVLAEVHRANMSKLDAGGKPLLREDGKVLKSALYRPPDVAAVLAAQSAVEVLHHGDRVRIDAPKVSKNHGRFGVVESADEFAASVLLDGDKETWLFGRGAVRRVETEASDD